uniref:Uncharacterized protein n=1 Tax=Arundo donax TaxID=35708 RepID=A0A0A9GG96_ARUDO
MRPVHTVPSPMQHIEQGHAAHWHASLLKLPSQLQTELSVQAPPSAVDQSPAGISLKQPSIPATHRRLPSPQGTAHNPHLHTSLEKSSQRAPEPSASSSTLRTPLPAIPLA